MLDISNPGSTETHTALDVASYLFIGLGTSFSLFSVILIAANCQEMWSNTYARLNFIIQLLILVACVSDIPYYNSDDDKGDTVACKLSGALFYTFFLVKIGFYIRRVIFSLS